MKLREGVMEHFEGDWQDLERVLGDLGFKDQGRDGGNFKAAWKAVWKTCPGDGVSWLCQGRT